MKVSNVSSGVSLNVARTSDKHQDNSGTTASINFCTLITSLKSKGEATAVVIFDSKKKINKTML